MTVPLERLFADGGYYDHAKVQTFIEQRIIPAILPPKTAVIQGKESTAWHDWLVSYIQNKGFLQRVRLWH